jgi:hypothetical protein
VTLIGRFWVTAEASADFRKDTVNWLFVNSEDVGDSASMMSIAMLVGLVKTKPRLGSDTHPERFSFVIQLGWNRNGAAYQNLISTVISDSWAAGAYFQFLTACNADSARSG